MCAQGITYDESKHSSVGSVVDIIFGKIETSLVAHDLRHDAMVDFVQRDIVSFVVFHTEIFLFVFVFIIFDQNVALAATAIEFTLLVVTLLFVFLELLDEGADDLI